MENSKDFMKNICITRTIATINKISIVSSNMFALNNDMLDVSEPLLNKSRNKLRHLTFQKYDYLY